MPITLTQSRKELGRAADAAKALRSATTFEQADRAWKDFFHATERAWNKVKARSKTFAQYDSWIGARDKIRREDPLLSYITNARGADEHTLAETAGIEFRNTPMYNLGVRGEDGSVVLLRDVPVIQEWYEQIGFTPDAIMQVDEDQRPNVPARLMRLPQIINRGVPYDPPTSHLGQPIDPQDYVTIAERALAWYETAIGEAETYAWTSKRTKT